jgi:uncharacterized 2Fe-2S/4Fe-4S cluster protein (DUF4445 family)
MPVLTIQLDNGERHIPFSVNRSLRDILDATDIRVRSGCRGLGTCGLCRVRIEAGDAGKSTFNENIILDNSEREQGVRLACQVFAQEDLCITILAPAPKSDWRNLPEGEEGTSIRNKTLLPLKNLPHNVTTPYGVAVDLGTTHIRLSLYELTGGEWRAGRYGLNPQARYGSDIMTRLVAASESAEQADVMSQLVLTAIAEALFDIASREGLAIEQVVRVTLVGNTAMLALLTGRNHALLLRTDHWMRPIDCLPGHLADWAVPLGIHPDACIEIMPPLAGFVGSDLLAGVVATGLREQSTASLLIDFGTNTEMALWDGLHLWVTSAAGGPAFEESGISCGSPAEAGAVNRVRIRNGLFDYDVIGNGEAHGLCGSGMVDLIACLVKSGLLSERGRFAPSVSEAGFEFVRECRSIILTKRDVDIFQQAKAAIGTGIQILLALAGVECKDLQRICIGGFFGRFLSVTNAQEIGLLPAIPPELVELCGSTALAGCAEALVSDDCLKQIVQMGTNAQLINISDYHGFDELFLRNLYLQPMQGGMNQGADNGGI